MQKHSLANCVENELQHYFATSNKGGKRKVEIKNRGEIYDLIIGQVESVMIKTAMENCRNNQSEVARILGIHRNTLATKLKKYNLE
ncbi:MAG: Fis family transcriptional regulator [Neisseriaceae bacterium]|nr:Fis family transcriptional regulator [Neisseriaceae bacterium]MBP5789453.1 Fis family transcriptional regulator [Neisseriaceae bacterium]MBQ5429667.1 Fis family transcriptional regulator [Neisseriaceae bacterium]